MVNMQNYIYITKLKKNKSELEKSLRKLEKYDQDDECIRMIKMLKDRIRAKQKHIDILEAEIKA